MIAPDNRPVVPFGIDPRRQFSAVPNGRSLTRRNLTLRLFSNPHNVVQPVSGSTRLTWCLRRRPVRVQNVCKQAKSSSDRDSESQIHLSDQALSDQAHSRKLQDGSKQKSLVVDLQKRLRPRLEPTSAG
jgi:hypothetical protein